MNHHTQIRLAPIRTACVIAALLLLFPLTAAPVDACRQIALPVPTESQVFFTGVATADTLEAGPGDVKYGLRDGRPGQAPAQPIRGQVFRIERIGGPQAGGLGGLSAGLGEIIVVPWDYDASCEILAWTASAYWTPPGTYGFVIGTLRAREHWVDGRPTVDTHNPYNLPYTGRKRIRGTPRDVPIEDFLSPGHVFELHQVMPTRSGLARAEAEALAPLRAWVAEHPDLARRPPAAMMLGFVLHALDRAARLETDHPVLGTWRFTLHAPGQGAHTFYARSEPHPMGRWSPDRAPPRLDAGGLRLRPADGYTFLVMVGSSLEDLPATVERRLDHVRAYMYALAHPDAPDAPDEEELSWRGWIEPSLLKKAIPEDSLVQRAAAEATERFRARYQDDLPTETPARFSLGADGVLRVVQEFSLTEAQALVLEGERISRTVVLTREAFPGPASEQTARPDGVGAEAIAQLVGHP